MLPQSWCENDLQGIKVIKCIELMWSRTLCSALSTPNFSSTLVKYVLLQIYHHEYLLLTKKQVMQKQTQEVVFTIPIFEPLPSQYYIRAISDRWIGSETYCPISFQHLILPERHPPHTDLLDLQPLPVNNLATRGCHVEFNLLTKHKYRGLRIPTI